MAPHTAFTSRVQGTENPPPALDGGFFLAALGAAEALPFRAIPFSSLVLLGCSTERASFHVSWVGRSPESALELPRGVLCEIHQLVAATISAVSAGISGGSAKKRLRQSGIGQ